MHQKALLVPPSPQIEPDSPRSQTGWQEAQTSYSSWFKATSPFSVLLTPEQIQTGRACALRSHDISVLEISFFS